MYERIKCFDRKEADIIPLDPQVFTDLETDQLEVGQKESRPLIRVEVSLYYGDPDIEYTDACKDFDDFLINYCKFTLIEFVPPMCGGTGGYIAYRHFSAKDAEEVKLYLVNKIIRLGLEDNAPQIDIFYQSVCQACSDPKFFKTIMDFGYSYCGNCGRKLNIQQWSYGKLVYLKLM